MPKYMPSSQMMKQADYESTSSFMPAPVRKPVRPETKAERKLKRMKNGLIGLCGK